MFIIAEASEEEMVAAFLKAELGSSRYGEAYTKYLESCNAPSSLITEPDLSNDAENQVRAKVLDMERGYLQGDRLFSGLPKQTIWKRVVLEPSDFSKMKYGRFTEWIDLTQGSRLVIDGARNFLKLKGDNPAIRRVLAVTEDIARGVKLPELIFLEDTPSGALLLFEGHVRATAYMLQKSLPKGIEAIVSHNTDVTGWRFY
jgi:hypothetical protein